MCGVLCPQLAERAVFQMKQYEAGGSLSSWQLEEAQVFWAKGEQGLALGLLKQMIHSLEDQVRYDHIHLLLGADGRCYASPQESISQGSSVKILKKDIEP